MDSMILLQIGGFIGFLFLLFIIYILNEKALKKILRKVNLLKILYPKKVL